MDRSHRLGIRRDPIGHYQPALSRWFARQIAASSGFVVYSGMLGNWVFVMANMLMLATAGLGHWLFLANRRREETGR